ncbi:MAG: hypothetical protein Q4G40_09220 [Brachybacterium sp.]|nr:hypothetical protein [Brachybacterium sp.]
MPTHRGTFIPPEPWRPGSWQPARYSLEDSVALTVGLVCFALIRGYDYLTPSVHHSPSLSIVEAAFPLHVWGALFSVPALVLAASVLLRIHIGVWIGHWLLAIAYMGLAMGLGLEFLSRPWGDGIRTASTLILPAVLHLVAALRTGWRPVPWRTSTSEN